ncbi:MAG: chemotaxis response regulator protein-glutamate methylesterase [Bdellovibrionales bacterium]|nr:chemotaxis response regulator protein-glutamate methylesterase [Bdellovibrionales bacterium]
MSKIRVLVVDDAVVIRKILTDVLSSDPDIEIAGVAANGKIALQKIEQCNPDVVTLDIEMPEMNGIETVGEIRKRYPKLPVIMFSTLSERGATATLDALAAGASDYCTKPANVGSVGEARERVKSELIAKVRGLCGRAAVKQEAPKAVETKVATTSIPTKPLARKSLSTSRPASDRTPRILAIGVSTGGPNALAEFIPALPGDLGVPIVCVQHMPPVFTKMLADRLNSTSELKVVEGQVGMPLEPNTMYIAPGNHHMVIERKGTTLQIVLNQDPPENSCRPAVDPLFRSVVQHFGGDVLGVILTGMGSDGLIGCEHLKEVGATVFAQDKDSSVVWGMPGYVAEHGLADKVLPLSEMAFEVARAITRRDKSKSIGKMTTEIGHGT